MKIFKITYSFNSGLDLTGDVSKILLASEWVGVLLENEFFLSFVIKSCITIGNFCSGNLL